MGGRMLGMAYKQADKGQRTEEQVQARKKVCI